MKEEVSSKISDVIEKIPDIWFDWYGRLVPGCIGILLYVITFEVDIKLVSSNAILIILIGYLLGHIIQPISSSIVNKTLNNVVKRKSPIISKAYAEYVGFCSMSIISFIVLFVYFVKNVFPCVFLLFTNKVILLILFVILFVVSTYLRKKAFLRKVNVTIEKQ
jgi:tetrahydromethanopterin S-methyltransferase subunit C